MERLLETAKKFLSENLDLNEVELSDGINKVKVVRNAPNIWYYQPQPIWQYTYQPAGYGTNP